jgi:diphosphomevalonate decarboxylase
MSVKEAAAVAHPNIALSKYWGKRPGSGNMPAVPSLSVTLGGLTTRTRVSFREDLAADRFVLDGEEQTGEARTRVVGLLDRVRAQSHEGRFAEVVSTNDFPTAAGIASSASGFAALALATTRAVGLDWDAARVSDLARRSSASAARSVFGGWVELEAGPEVPNEGELHCARAIVGAEHLPLRVLVCVTSAAKKAVSSSTAMRRTAAESPYYPAWLAAAPRLHADLRAALLARDFARLGEVAEASALAMHASAIAAGVVYWSGATLDAIAAVRELRACGTPAYFTVDAGPQVKVIVRPDDVEMVLARMAQVPGVLRVLPSSPGEGARPALAEESP